MVGPWGKSEALRAACAGSRSARARCADVQTDGHHEGGQGWVPCPPPNTHARDTLYVRRNASTNKDRLLSMVGSRRALHLPDEVELLRVVFIGRADGHAAPSRLCGRA